MDTNIFIRAHINGKPESIDIGDPRLSTEQLLRWLNTKTSEYREHLFDHMKEVFEREIKPDEEQR